VGGPAIEPGCVGEFGGEELDQLRVERCRSAGSASHDRSGASALIRVEVGEVVLDAVVEFKVTSLADTKSSEPAPA